MNNNKSNLIKIRKFSLSFCGFWMFVLFLSVIWTSCNEAVRDELYDINAPAPVQVENLHVLRNTPGGAILKYTIPKDENLLYVRAEYEIRPGMIRGTKSSFYNDTLVIEGFGNEGIYDVKVFSVGKNNKESEPLIVSIEPTKPPIQLALKSLEKTFNGVKVRLENPERANLAIELMGDTGKIKLGYQISLQTFYTNAENAVFTFRGVDTVENNFSVYLRDRWFNLSDTIHATLKPDFEQFIPKETWKEFGSYPYTTNPGLVGDAYRPSQGFEPYSLPSMWDGDYTTQWQAYVSEGTYPMPQWITWDLGVTVILNRLRIFHHPDNERLYGQFSPKIFEIYGTAGEPLPGWDNDSWILLGCFETLPPSGLDIPTSEDRQHARNGIDLDFEITDLVPDPYVPVRYMRFKTLETFNGPRQQDAVMINQIDFWGVIIEDN